MTTQHEEMLKDKFGLIMTKAFQDTGTFSLERFAQSAVCLLNVLVNSRSIAKAEKLECAIFLCNEYNMGIGNELDRNDIAKISSAIISDPEIDFVLLRGVL